MNANWLGAFCAVAAIFLAWGICRWAKTKPVKTRLWLTAGAGVLAIPGASFAIHYAHVMPEWEWYYEFRSWRGTELLVLLVGLAGGLAASLLPGKRWHPFALVATGAMVVVPFIKPFVGPMAVVSQRDLWDDGVCLQSTLSTCGPSSIATILTSEGIQTSEAEMVADSHTYLGGTEAWYLARAVRARGCEASFSFSEGFNPEIALPAMAGVRVSRYGHFIPLLSREGDNFVIGDPLQGRETLSREQLLARYRFTGFYLLVRRGDEQDRSDVGLVKNREMD